VFRRSYFMYDLDPPNYGERFSTRKRYSVSAFYMIEELRNRSLADTAASGRNSDEWVLVLPPFTLTFDGTRATVPWRELFDLEVVPIARTRRLAHSIAQATVQSTFRSLCTDRHLSLGHPR
jgi:hypothetical protein